MDEKKNKKLVAYYKLWCGHIQLSKVEGKKFGETRIYCRICKDHSTVVGMSPSRWD